MNRFSLFLVAILLLSSTGFAQQRSAEEAAALAAQCVNGEPALRRVHRAPQTAAEMRLVHTCQKASREENAFYIFNRADKAGFIIVSADERTADEVIAYSEEGQFDMQTVNPNLRWWLERMEAEISSIPEETEVNPAPQIDPAEPITPIAPLLKNASGQSINWYQETPYNNLCPMDQRDNTRCLTGCVATAASMVMYKWQWPKKGTGQSSYTWKDYKDDYGSRYWTQTLSANYGETTYDWEHMLPTYEGKEYSATQANAVATIMYHAGVASEMQYGGQKTGGSGTLTDKMAYGLITYFGYKIDKFISMYSSWTYGGAHSGVNAEWNVTTDQITEYFNADLEAGRPIIMGGEDSSSGGHEFVCDGRDKNGRFHINWGWEGDGNCYTALTTMRPTMTTYNFNGGLDAIIGLEPNTPEAVEQTTVMPEAEKVLRDGQILIQRGEKTYTLTGQALKN